VKNYNLQETFVISGPDGSGKSSICEKLQEKLNERGVNSKIIKIWDAIKTTDRFENQKEVLSYLKNLDSLERLEFIFESLRRAYGDIDLRNKTRRNIIYLIEGGWQKYAVSELGFGNSWELITKKLKSKNFSKYSNQVGKLFYLNIGPEVAWERKQKASLYECGGVVPSKNNFIKFQTGLQKYWQEISNNTSKSCENNWEYVDATQSLELVVNHVYAEILRCLEKNSKSF